MESSNELLRRKVERPQAHQTQTGRRVKVIRREDCMTVRVLNWYLLRVNIGLSALKVVRASQDLIHINVSCLYYGCMFKHAFV